MAPKGAVAKITGKEGLEFLGKARTFDTEDAFVEAVESGSIKKGEKTAVILRYLGPKGGPGMPEMLKPTSLIMGAGLGQDVACLTDGRFSGGWVFHSSGSSKCQKLICCSDLTDSVLATSRPKPKLVGPSLLYRMEI